MDYALKKKLFHGKLSKGCKQCIKGEKLVLFATGLCPRSCFYCPVSEKKKFKDVIYANEMPIKKTKDIIIEARLMNAKGAGITGGDPLVKIKRTCKFIRLLKKEFGKRFHIHLYTSLNLLSRKKLDMLEKAGLDELRIHPDIYDDKLWNKIDLAKGYGFDLGIEIPVIPGTEKQTYKLIEYFKDKVDFINLNELEISETNIELYHKKNLHTKNKYSYAVSGSEEMAKKIIKKIIKKCPKLNIHYCTASFKDKIQMGRRIMRRAKNVRKAFDIVTSEGMLIRGAIYNNIKRARSFLKKQGVPEKFIYIDKKNGRVLTAAIIVKQLAGELKKLKLKPAIVEEYPTFDEMQVSVDFL